MANVAMSFLESFGRELTKQRRFTLFLSNVWERSFCAPLFDAPKNTEGSCQTCCNTLKTSLWMLPWLLLNLFAGNWSSNNDSRFSRISWEWKCSVLLSPKTAAISHIRELETLYGALHHKRKMSKRSKALSWPWSLIQHPEFVIHFKNHHIHKTMNEESGAWFWAGRDYLQHHLVYYITKKECVSGTGLRAGREPLIQ